jgi:molybdopterin synthase sulfur carrier subunit
MATVVFTQFIQHYVKCPPMDVRGNTVREVLETYFQEFRRARGYILDDKGCLRPRLALFVDGTVVMDRIGLSDPVHMHARVFVQQMPLDTEYESLN